jgi:hypothetical protein
LQGRGLSVRRISAVIVVLHLLISIPHGSAHSELHIRLAQWQSAYILLVITVLPFVALMVMWKARRVGFLLLLVSMAASFIFGVFYHFIAVGPDNINSLPAQPSAHTFQWTAIALALIEAAGFLAGLIGWSRSRAA